MFKCIEIETVEPQKNLLLKARNRNKKMSENKIQYFAKSYLINFFTYRGNFSNINNIRNKFAN